MDPVSQGILGGSASLACAKQPYLLIATVCGIIAGMAPDLDALIRSDNDPLLYLEFHRQFTHSLIFIPFGALICAAVFWVTFARKLSFKQVYIYSFVGYATHGLLDSCTTYGTQLFWPFSNMRVAWHTVSIIDPLFTLPLILLVAIGIKRSAPLFGTIAVVWAIAYLSFGALQRERAEDFATQLADLRGHQFTRLEAKPSFGNLLIWKIIYEADEKYFVDAVRVGISLRHFPGDAVNKLNIQRDLPWLDGQSQQARDLERFRWFSNDFLAQQSQRPDFIIDMRYSMLPNEVDGLWGIQLNRQKDAAEHVAFVWDRNVPKEKRDALWRMLFNQSP